MDAMTSTSTLTEHPAAGRGFAGHAMQWLRAHRRWLVIVMLPTLAVALYFWLIAADQYESEAHFIVRAAQETQAAPSGLGAALSLVGGVSQTQSDAHSVGDYLTSHDAVAALQKRVDLIARFRRPEADFLSRLSPADPPAEKLLKYYRKQVSVKFDSETGIATLKVRSFRPQDSYAIVNALLELGEARVNSLNGRAYTSTLGVARTQLSEAEEAVNRAQAALTAFRQGRRDIDPASTGEAQLGLGTQLQARLAQARALQEAMGRSLSPDSPQIVAQRARVQALETQVSQIGGRMTGGAGSIAAGLGDYQGLLLRQQFAAKRYDAAAASMERAREQAQKQQLFIVRVVQPNLPEKSTYPKGGTVILTVFFGLLLAYAIGWLIAAGVREHAA